MRELDALHVRTAIVRDRLDGVSISAIAEAWGVSERTVRKWIRRYETEGVDGLVSRKPTGRPREVDPRIRRELTRLPQETRPPIELGDQWTVRTLAEAFGVSPAFVSVVWREDGFDPPLHLQQVEAYPDRSVALRAQIEVPAWFRLHLEIGLKERDITLDDHVRSMLVGPDGLADYRDDVITSLRDRWTEANEKLPRVDPRSPQYRRTLHQRYEP